MQNNFQGNPLPFAHPTATRRMMHVSDTDLGSSFEPLAILLQHCRTTMRGIALSRIFVSQVMTKKTNLPMTCR